MTISIMKYNQQIFKETTRIIKLGHYIDFEDHYHDISDKIKNSVANTITIPETYSFETSLSRQLDLIKTYGETEKQTIVSKIEITQESTQAAARRFKENNVRDVCVLNFANGLHPGGGVLDGCVAQEETICRQSNLYFCLKNQSKMYEFNIKKGDPMCSDYMIYSPDVVFFRDDEYELVYPIRVSVITSPAPDLRGMQITPEVKQLSIDLIKNRCRRIIQMAMRTQRRVLILGAFGCGAFLNSPDDVSKIFKELLVDEFYGMFFTNIIFPIFTIKGLENKNYDIFKETFNK